MLKVLGELLGGEHWRSAERNRDCVPIDVDLLCDNCRAWPSGRDSFLRAISSAMFLTIMVLVEDLSLSLLIRLVRVSSYTSVMNDKACQDH